MTAAKPRGGARAGTGPKTDKTRKIKRVLLGIYEDQHDKLKAVGGSSWVRKQLDKTKL
jgi:hypothetical protein